MSGGSDGVRCILIVRDSLGYEEPMTLGNDLRIKNMATVEFGYHERGDSESLK